MPVNGHFIIQEVSGETGKRSSGGILRVASCFDFLMNWEKNFNADGGKIWQMATKEILIEVCWVEKKVGASL